MGSCSLLQGIFPTQGSNAGLLHCRQILYWLSLQGGPEQAKLISNDRNQISDCVGQRMRLALRNWVGAFCDSGSVLDLKQGSVMWVLMFVKHIEWFTLKIWDILLCATLPWKYPCSILINVKQKKRKVKLIYDVESQNSDYHCGVMVVLIGEGAMGESLPRVLGMLYILILMEV